MNPTFRNTSLTTIAQPFLWIPAAMFNVREILQGTMSNCLTWWWSISLWRVLSISARLGEFVLLEIMELSKFQSKGVKLKRNISKIGSHVKSV